MASLQGSQAACPPRALVLSFKDARGRGECRNQVKVRKIPKTESKRAWDPPDGSQDPEFETRCPKKSSKISGSKMNRKGQEDTKVNLDTHLPTFLEDDELNDDLVWTKEVPSEERGEEGPQA